VKFSLRQILASSAGAVIAAVIASSFGVKGTVVGVAIGAAVATTATALVSQSIERGHAAVRQVVQAPEAPPLLRKLGSTGSSGVASTQAVPVAGEPTGGADETVAFAPGTAEAAETQRLEVTAATSVPAPESLWATSSVAPVRRRGAARRPSWKAVAGTMAVVFLLALGFVTAIELISGKPLSSIFGGAGTGTSVGGIFGGNSPPPTTSPSTTTTTTPPTTTTSTNAATTTTTTTAASTSTTVGTTSTSTTQPGGSTTTTTVRPGSTTTTTRPGAP